jgi:hypothetical protein
MQQAARLLQQAARLLQQAARLRKLLGLSEDRLIEEPLMQQSCPAAEH